jgi:Nitrate and nitrite sensing
VPQRIPIRLKLTAALAIPIAALLIVASLEVLQSARQADEVRDQTSLATAAIGPSGLINNVLNERNYGSADLLGATIEREGGVLDLPVESFEEAGQKTDESLAALREDVEARGGRVADEYLPVLDKLEEGLGPLREQVNGYEGTRTIAYSVENKPVQDLSDEVFVGYSTLITDLFETNTQVALAVDNPTLRRGAELNDLATRTLDTVSQVVRLLLLASVSGQEVDGQPPNRLDTPEEVAAVSAAYGQVLSSRETTEALGTGPYRDVTQEMVAESDDTGFFDVTDRALETGEVDTEEVFRSVSIPEDQSLYGYPADLKEVIDAEAGKLNDQAAARQQWYLALAALAVIVALVMTWLASRSIT